MINYEWQCSVCSWEKKHYKNGRDQSGNLSFFVKNQLVLCYFKMLSLDEQQPQTQIPRLLTTTYKMMGDILLTFFWYLESDMVESFIKSCAFSRQDSLFSVHLYPHVCTVKSGHCTKLGSVILESDFLSFSPVRQLVFHTDDWQRENNGDMQEGV